MDDPSAPAVPTIGGTLATSGWKHGNETLGMSASDSGGGVAAITPTVDQGSNPQGVAGDCPRVGGYYIRMAACAATSSGSVSVNTAAIGNGTGTLTVEPTGAFGFSAGGRCRRVWRD